MTGLVNELDATMDAIKRVPWTMLNDLRGDPEVLKRIDDAEAPPKSLQKTLSS